MSTLKTRQAIEIAKAAGAKILELFLPDIMVTTKSDDTPLTAADLAANKIIIEQLQNIDSTIPILTEETCSTPLSVRSEWDTYWLVDPLDGTREFIKKNGEFSVNIALIEHGTPVIGVVHAPVLNITYWASIGRGAWKQAGNDSPRRINVRTAAAESITVAVGWAPQFSRPLAKFLQKLGNHKELRMGGALKSCLVAEGRADIYACFGPTGEWDTAAAHCIVTEAGGSVTDTQLKPLQYNTKHSLLNPDFFVFGKSTRHWPDYL